MAEKPGFLIMHKTFRALDKLPDDQFRAMLRAMCDYSENGTEPVFDDPAMETIFMTLRDWLDEDANSYARKIVQRKNAIEKRWAMERAKKAGKDAQADTEVYDRIRPNTDEYELYQFQNQNQIQNQIQNQSLSLSEREGTERERLTLEMVEEYARDAGLDVDARQFIAQNEATGWTDGNGRPVKNWRIWLQGWAARNRHGPPARPTPTAMQFEQRTYTADELKALTDKDFENALKAREDNA